VPVLVGVKLSESEKRVEEVDNKCEVLCHTLRDKQAVCDMQQSRIDVSFSDSIVTFCDVLALSISTISLFVLTALRFNNYKLRLNLFHLVLFLHFYTRH